MATRAIWTAEAGIPPDSNPAAYERTNEQTYLAFDDTTSESTYLRTVAPQGLTGALSLVVSYMAASATSGTFTFAASVEAVTSGDALDLDAAASFDTVNTASADTVPATAGYMKQVTITLTNNDSMAAGDIVTFKLSRDISDTATGDARVLRVEFRDAA